MSGAAATVAALAAALAMAVAHVAGGDLHAGRRLPRSAWLSLAGGISVAYIFVHLLPELQAGQEVLAEATEGILGFLEHHVYLLALTGLAAFYGLERVARSSRRERDEDTAAMDVFALHVGSYAFYNLLIGYLLVSRAEEGATALALYTVAMGLHFVVNDVGLREHFEGPYRRWGRWLLAGTVLAGWALGSLVELSEAVLIVPLAFLAGGVVLNVLKEELPEERESRFWAFAAGAAGYAALLLVV